MSDLTDQLDPDEVPWALASLFQGLAHPGIVASLGMDDCSVIRLGEELLVLSTDFVNAAPIGLELGIADHGDLGYYLTASNMSDLIGTGAEPIGLLASVMWNRETPKALFEELMIGVRDACEQFGVALLGGDTKLTSGRTVLHGAAFGRASSEDELFLQSRARVGQGIWVSGRLGACAAAVVGLTELDLNPRLSMWAQNVIRRPTLPIALSRAVASLQLCAGGADISDGLGADLGRVCRVSGVSAEVDADSIPLEDEVAEIANLLGVSASKFAFVLGGDLQFFITSDRRENELERLGLSRVGEIVAGESSVSTQSGRFAWPDVGHRDVRNLTFAAEVRQLIDEMAYS